MLDNLEQNLTKAFATMCIADTSEAKEAALQLPLCMCRFLDPVTCHYKIAICVAGLPCITGQIDLTTDSRATEFSFQIIDMVVEYTHDM
jgi:hypothetical protein